MLTYKLTITLLIQQFNVESLNYICNGKCLLKLRNKKGPEDACNIICINIIGSCVSGKKEDDDDYARTENNL